MEADEYRTLAAPAEAIYTEKRSKFIAIALPVHTLEEVKAHLEELQKKYYDARHVCYAYMLGHERTNFRANDNGEPSGTAGKPILGQINSNELTDVLVAVVRYLEASSWAQADSSWPIARLQPKRCPQPHLWNGP